MNCLTRIVSGRGSPCTGSIPPVRGPARIMRGTIIQLMDYNSLRLRASAAEKKYEVRTTKYEVREEGSRVIEYSNNRTIEPSKYEFWSH